MFSALLCEDLYSQYEPSCLSVVYECLYALFCEGLISECIYVYVGALTATPQQHLGDVCVMVQQGIV